MTDELRRLMTLVERVAGIRLDAAATSAPLEHLLAARSAALGVTSDVLVDLFERDPATRQSLLDALTVNYTWFDRDAPLLQLAVEALAPLRRPAQVWVAGCSSGEDAYGLVMRGLEAKVELEVLATDLSAANIAAARTARYGAWALRELAGPLQRFFRSEGLAFEVDAEVRRRCSFEVHNLMTPPPPGPFDLVFCRNVLIYFSAETAAAVRRRMRGVLRPGGWLVQGASEPVLAAEEGLSIAALGPRVALRHAPPSPVAPVLVPPAPPPLVPPSPRAVEPPPPRPVDPPPKNVSWEIRLREGARRLQYAPGEALTVIDAVRAEEPLSAEAHFCAGLALFLMGDALGASGALRSALTLEPRLWPAAFYAARAAELLGERDQARTAWRQVVDNSQAPVPILARLALGDFEVWRMDVLSLAAKRVG